MTTRDPMISMMRELDELERMFELEAPRDDELHVDDEAATPPCEIVQRGSDLCIRVDLPGMRRDDILVTAADHLLVIEASRSDPGERETVWSSEITHGIYRRVITLPPGVATDAIDASYIDGVLEIRIEVPPQLRARRIHITNGRRQLPE